MGVPDYSQIEKIEVEDLIESFDEFFKDEFHPIFLSVPIEHYSIDDLKKLSDKAREKNLVMSIRYERSNFYYGALVSFSSKDENRGKHKDTWLDML